MIFLRLNFRKEGNSRLQIRNIVVIFLEVSKFSCKRVIGNNKLVVFFFFVYCNRMELDEMSILNILGSVFYGCKSNENF